METMPRKFFGCSISNIRTEQDALHALDSFIRNADDAEINVACRELEALADPVRSVIRGLLWKLEYDLSSPEWLSCFELKYASA